RVARVECACELDYQRTEELLAQRRGGCLHDRLDGLFGVSAHRHVAHEHRRAGDVALGVDDRVVALVEIANFPAGCAEHALRPLPLAPYDSCEDAAYFLVPLGRGKTYRVHAHGELHSEISLEGAAQGVVDHGDTQVAVDRGDAVVGRVDRRREQRLTTPHA